MLRRPDRHADRVEPARIEHRRRIRMARAHAIAVRDQREPRRVAVAERDEPHIMPHELRQQHLACMRAAADPADAQHQRAPAACRKPRSRSPERRRSASSSVRRRPPLRERHRQPVIGAAERLERDRARVARLRPAPCRSPTSRDGRCRGSRDGSRWPGNARGGDGSRGSPPAGRHPPCSCGRCRA